MGKRKRITLVSKQTRNKKKLNVSCLEGKVSSLIETPSSIYQTKKLNEFSLRKINKIIQFVVGIAII